MKKVVLALIVFLAFTFTIGYSIYGKKTDGKGLITLEGYLIDKHCVDRVKGVDETITCLKMPVCEKSGYGLAVDINSDKDKFVQFDEHGHDLAKEIIDNAKSDKIGEVIVKGHYEGDNFAVDSITNK